LIEKQRLGREEDILLLLLLPLILLILLPYQLLILLRLFIVY
jgi:hypothetical protein